MDKFQPNFPRRLVGPETGLIKIPVEHRWKRRVNAVGINGVDAIFGILVNQPARLVAGGVGRENGPRLPIGCRLAILPEIELEMDALVRGVVRERVLTLAI